MKKLLLCTGIGFCLLFNLPVFSQKVTHTSFKYIDPANMDPNVKPGDNFYMYANGNWIRNNPVPASKTRWGSFDVLRENSLDRLRTLAQEAAAHPEKSPVYKRVGDLYASAMDSAAIEKLGYSPIKADLDAINNYTSKDQVINAIATQRTRGLGGALYGFGVSPDSKNVTKYMVRLGQGGTTLPDRDYYIKNDSRSLAIRNAYSSYMTDIFKMVGDDAVTAARKADEILSLETGLAKAQLSRVEMRNPQRLYNKYAIADLSKETPGLDWKMLMGLMKANNADSVIVNNPAFLKTASVLISAVPLESWKAYLQWNVIKSKIPYLSSAFVNRSFKFTQVLSGQKEMTPRWQQMSGLVDGSLGDLMGQLYVEKYFTPAAKQRMLALVNNIQQTFADRISRVEWMSDSTKQRALEKLHAIVNKIGFPDKWDNYDGVVINRNDLVGNMISINEFNYNKNINKLGKPVDKTEWGMTPPTINAYYNPSNNEIVFPAGILQFPFYDFNADDAVNYGGAAAVIGHELTHGFDDQGRQYAADGNLKEWWTATDAKKFTQRANMVVSQYNNFTVNDSIHVNGQLTLGENLADLGGLNIAYEAFRKTPEAQKNEKIGGFTPDQRFFLSWAQIWRSNTLPETAGQLVLTDPHSPGEYRCNGPITNIDAWYAAFNVKPGDKLYKPEADRIKIW